MIQDMNDSRRPRFVGRRSVLAALDRHREAVASSGSGRIVALRGRRQVGKSTLVERFVQEGGTPYVFATGVFGAPLPQQLDAATSALATARKPVPNADLLSQSTATTWREWLGRIAIAAASGPVVVVLDEFPWMAAGDPTLEGELQVAWDRTLEKLPVLLILVGSDVAMMERLSEHGRPLFGRLQPLVVPALDPGEVAEALPGWDPFDVFDAYLITGGYPRLVTDLMASSHASAAAWARESLADVFTPLVATARITLDAEFPEPTTAYQVLAAIGADETARPGFNDVLSAIADPAERKRTETAITRALTTLTTTKALIDREVPAWAPPSSKLRRYRLTDPYLRFWFRYVQRHVEAIARGRGDLAVAAFDRDWSSWRGRSVEPVVRAAIERLAVDDARFAGVETVRPWWVRDGSVEIDVVAATSSATAVLGTIKWRAGGGVTAAEIDDLRRARDRVPRAEAARLAAIVPSGQAADGADVVLSATDLLAAWG